MDKKKKLERIQKRIKILEKDVLTDSDLLTILMLDIEPYSRYWWLGMIKALKHAIKLLEKEEKNK